MDSRSLTMLIPSVFLVWGCSAVKFTAKSCEGDTNCLAAQGEPVSGRLDVKGGRVDVLIVNDNSASMSSEQSQLAQRFNRFLAEFDQRFIEYRIATTTTDISSAQNPARAINQNGALQDGKLIAFSNGQSFLTPESGTAAERSQMFNQAIRRSETLACEQFISNWVASGKSRDSQEYAVAYQSNCPSTDERGTYAANLVVQSNPASFIRPEADLAIIFLADEDVRSQRYWNNEPGFTLEEFDKASVLVSKVKEKYPQKTLGLHAIVVRDANCLAQQSSQLSGIVSGSYGWEYHRGAQATSGVTGDICATDYTQQLIDIFNNIQGKIVDKIAFPCQAPQLEIINLTMNTNDPSITWSVVGSEIRFSKKLPVGTRVDYTYRCKPAGS